MGSAAATVASSLDDTNTDGLTQVRYLQEPKSYAPVSINDINQGGLGDCFLLAAVGELALDRPAAITNMISANADGTETVTLYEKAGGGAPSYGDTSLVPTRITVDNVFPENAVNSGYDQDVFDGQQEIWAQVLEKALATLSGGYDVINQGGWPMFVMEELTGQAGFWQAPTSLSLPILQGYMKAGDLVAFDTPASNGLAYDLIDDHAYMLEGLSMVNGQAMVQLGNPWGDSEPQLIPLSQVGNEFDEIDVGPDATAPTAPVAPIDLGLSTAGGASCGTSALSTPTIAGIAQDGSTVVLSDPGGVLGGAVADQYGAWSITLPVSPHGTYQIAATATNTYGEKSASSRVFTLTIDTVVPDAPTGLALAASSDSGLVGDDVTNDDHPNISGEGTAGDTVSLYDFGTILVGKTVVGTDGTWSVTPAQAFADGSYSLSATLLNAADNISPASAVLHLAIDTTPPAAPSDLLLMADGSSTADTTPTVTGTGEAGATVTLYDGAARIGFALVAADAAWSVTTTALAAGGHSLTATQSDAAANVSKASAALTIDIVPPAPPTSVTLGGGSQLYDALAGQTVQAGSGSDTVTASAGQATVMGSSGLLTFLGGSAASVADGGAGSAVLFGGAGGGRYVGGAAGQNILVSQGVAGILTRLTGAGAGDRIFGSAAGDDVLTAGSGRDSILGGGGQTTIDGGGTAGVMFTGDGPTTVNGGSGGQDTIVGGSGPLAVAAQEGDAIFGGTGALSVAASLQGADSIVGGAGRLDVAGRGGNMLVVAGTGTSRVDAGSGASLVFAGSGNLSLTGGAGSMQVVAGSGAATIDEGAGTTVLQVVSGAAGGSEVIDGFRPGIDTIDLFGYQPSQQSLATIGGSTVILLTDGTRITLTGVDDYGHSRFA